MQQAMLADAQSLEKWTYYLTWKHLRSWYYKNRSVLKPHAYVRYMTAEMWSVLNVFKFLFRSVPVKLRKKNTKHSDNYLCLKYDWNTNASSTKMLFITIITFSCKRSIFCKIYNIIKTELCHKRWCTGWQRKCFFVL